MEAAVEADIIRNSLIDKKQSFTFESVLSTDRNLKLLQRAKDNGYFIRCITKKNFELSHMGKDFLNEVKRELEIRE